MAKKSDEKISGKKKIPARAAGAARKAKAAGKNTAGETLEQIEAAIPEGEAVQAEAPEAIAETAPAESPEASVEMAPAEASAAIAETAPTEAPEAPVEEAPAETPETVSYTHLRAHET